MTSASTGRWRGAGGDIEILVVGIGDDPAVATVEAMLAPGHRDERNPHPVVTTAASMAEAVALVEDRVFDVVFLGLDRPDATDLTGLTTAGLTMVLRMVDAVPRSPVVVLTGASDESLALDVLRAGAHDHVPTTDLDATVLWHVIGRTLARHRSYLARVEVLEERRRLDTALSDLADDDGTSATGDTVGIVPLRERSIATFETLGERYRALLEMDLQSRQVTSEAGASEVGVRHLARDLGFLRAGPRDIVEMHVSATETAIRDQPRGRRLVLVENARLQVLELMGHLVSHYRSQFVGASPRSSAAAGGGDDGTR